MASLKLKHLQAGAGQWQTLELSYTAPDRGYVQIFVANESDQTVYFDDLEVEHTPQLIVQENHYYPFGMNLAGVEKLGKPEHKFQYNGKEKQEEFGLNWLSYGQREYDPVIGRFNRIDRFAEKYQSFNPYNYAGNNPIMNIDINGDSLQAVGTIQQVVKIIAAHADACDYSIKVDFSSNQGEQEKGKAITWTAKITGFDAASNDKRYEWSRKVLTDLIRHEKTVTETFVKTDPKKIDKVESMGGSYFDVNNNTIYHADHWIRGGWHENMVNPPKYNYVKSVDGSIGARFNKLLSGKSTFITGYKHTKFWEASAHESYHAWEVLHEFKGKSLKQLKDAISRFRNDFEHNAILFTNKIREAKGRKPRISPLKRD